MHKSIVTFLYLCVQAFVATAQQNTKQPNVILIVADDLGWADLGCYGSTFYETPNLDKLAANGVRFSQGYATSPVCSPTRASIMTGKYPVKTGVTDWIKGRQEKGKAQPYEKLIGPATAYELPIEENTIAELALANGYRTFFSGKWHLGEEEKYWPEHQGFQTNTGGWSAGSLTGRVNDTTGGFFTPYKNPRLKDGPPGEYLTDRLTNECIQFIDDNKHFPFFVTLSFYAVHNPLQAPTPLVKKYSTKQQQLGIQPANRFAKDEDWMKLETGWKRRLVQDNPVYAAMIENMDWNIGRLLDKIQQAGIDDNTLVIFTSDNGGLSTAEGSPTVNGPLRAGKGWLYEGGIRVPFIMYWKGKIVAGTVADVPVTAADIYPTIAKAIVQNDGPRKDIDGADILALLNKHKKAERPLFFHYPHYSNQGGKPGAAIREGSYKLVYFFEDKRIELYDLVNDVAEKNNLAVSHRKMAMRLSKKLFRWLENNAAKTPVINPGYSALPKPF